VDSPVPLAMIVDATQGGGAQGSSGRRGGRRILPAGVFRPWVLGIAALAMAVALWGYGYKLSLYRQPDQAACLPVAKLWIDHRNPVEVAVATVRSPAVFPVCIAVPVAAAPACFAEGNGVVLRPAETRGVATLGALTPFRSPPIPSFLPMS
jgi:hypothetical protein